MSTRKWFSLIVGIALLVVLLIFLKLDHIPIRSGHEQNGREVNKLLYHRFEVPPQATDVHYKSTNYNTWLRLSIEPEYLEAWCDKMGWKPFEPIPEHSPFYSYDHINESIFIVKNGVTFNCIDHGKGYFGVYDADTKVLKISFTAK